MGESERQYLELMAYAEHDPDVLGVYVFGSRACDGFADERSDYDVGVIVRDAAIEGFRRRWPYRHGAPVEVWGATLSEFRGYAEFGSATEWARYELAHITAAIDKLGGEIQRLLDEKATIPDDVRHTYTSQALDGYINATYRSHRNRMVGVCAAARLDAAESLPYVLTSIFALEGRVRPFNKYLEWELTHHPLADPEWSAERLLPRLALVLDGDAGEQHALFRDVTERARALGFGSTVDSWEPDVAWLRGEAEYRAGP